jgi:hypothetical protein
VKTFESYHYFASLGTKKPGTTRYYSCRIELGLLIQLRSRDIAGAKMEGVDTVDVSWLHHSQKGKD